MYLAEFLKGSVAFTVVFPGLDGVPVSKKPPAKSLLNKCMV